MLIAPAVAILIISDVVAISAIIAIVATHIAAAITVTVAIIFPAVVRIINSHGGVSITMTSSDVVTVAATFFSAAELPVPMSSSGFCYRYQGHCHLNANFPEVNVNAYFPEVSQLPKP